MAEDIGRSVIPDATGYRVSRREGLICTLHEFGGASGASGDLLRLWRVPAAAIPGPVKKPSGKETRPPVPVVLQFREAGFQAAERPWRSAIRSKREHANLQTLGAYLCTARLELPDREGILRLNLDLTHETVSEQTCAARTIFQLYHFHRVLLGTYRFGNSNK